MARAARCGHNEGMDGKRKLPFKTNWPSERENIELSVERLRGRTLDDALRDVAGMIALSLKLYPGPLEDAFAEEQERIGNERLIRWIRDHRRGPR